MLLPEVESEDDQIVAEIHEDRKRDTRPEIPE